MEEMKTTLKEIVAQRLSAAPDSVAKNELIEELSGNLYCRYSDLVSNGADPEDARSRAVDTLGDTDELVEYLKGLEPDQSLPELVLDPEKPDGGQIEEILHNVEEILRGAFHKAKAVFKEAKDTVKEGFEAEVSAETPVRTKDGALGELERKMADLEAAMEKKERQIEQAREALNELENARDALEEVSDRTAVEGMLTDLEVRIGAKEAEIEQMEAEYEAMEEAYDSAEEKLEDVEEALDEIEDAEFDEMEDLDDMEGESAPDKGWKVTYRNKDGQTVTVDSDGIKAAVKDAMKDIEVVIREATGMAKDACKVAKNVAEKACEDAVSACTPDSPVEADKPIDAARLKGIDVKMVGGDIAVRMTQDPDGDVLVGGNTEKLEVTRSESGVLTIRSIKTETNGFFFGRGIFNSNSTANVTLDLPRREWESLRLSTVGGEVELSGDCPVRGVTVTSVSGDITVSLPFCTRVDCRTTGGDIRWTGDVSGLHLESISGDLRYQGHTQDVAAKTTSGDIDVAGGFLTASVRTVSGDVRLKSDELPARVDVGTTSGDMRVDVPDAGPFTAKFRSTSGDFTSDFFTGRMGGRSCVFTYQGGGEREYSFSSISGNVEIRKYR